MSSKFLLFFLGTFLLVQSSFGKALPSSEESTEKAVDTTLQPEISDVSDSPSYELLFYVMNEFSKIANSSLKSGKKLLQDLIAEISALDDKNEDITARLEEYSELLADIEKLQTEEDSDDEFDNIELMTQLSDLLDKSNLTLIEEPTSVDKLFEESLQKNGLNDLEQQFLKMFEETFSKEFSEAVNEILNSATTVEWPAKSKFQDWLARFKAENDVEKKIEMFDEFFKLY